MTSYQRSPMAIVGISAELPSGSYSKENLDYHSYYDFLLNKGQAYETVPADRFDPKRWHGTGLGHTIAEKGSFLKGVPLFDYVEFGITSKDAKNMSLSTRKLIEHSFLSLLDAGIYYRGRNVGCYMSGTAFDLQGVTEPDELEAVGSFAGYPYMIANKVSYHLDLRGPSIPLDTACSSSLTALHLAIQAIRGGDCEAAVVGGCQLNFRLVDFIQYSQGSVLSPDGTCKPFDASADGFSRGEGVVVIVIKPLVDAIKDNDYVYATILNTGINSSGSLAPVSAPVAFAQRDAMCRAFKDISRSPREVDYVELHATGTAAGDPTEANWAGEVFGQRQSELLVGSVKGNIGHLDICAFLASLLKVCGIFQSRMLPATVNLVTPNPNIFWSQWNMRAPIESTFIDVGHELLVSITSSGIGGSNGHAVVESYGNSFKCTRPPVCTHDERPLLVLCGGLTPRSAVEISYSAQTTWNTLAVEDLKNFASICSRRGRQMPWQTFAIMLDHLTITPFHKPILLPKSPTRIAYVFSGQGPQYIRMGCQLYNMYPMFRESIQQMDATYLAITGRSIRSFGLFDNASTSDDWEIWPISMTSPAIAMVQMAIYDLLKGIGIAPHVVVGHSAGETAMMYASGACSKDMALQIAIARGLALGTLENLGGSMVALNCGPDTAQAIIDVVTENEIGVIRIACYNSDSAVTLAGTESLLEAAIAVAKERNVTAHKLRTKTAVHSEFVDHCKSVYCQQIEEIFARHHGDHKPSIATYSSTFGSSLDSFTADYFWQNARQPVRFNEAIKCIIKDHIEIAFVEISPHPVLSAYIVDNGVEADRVISFMKRTKTSVKPFSESHNFLQGVARLSLIGYTGIDFHSLNDTRPSAPECVASYPFSRRYVPFRPEPAKTTLEIREDQWKGPLSYPGLRLNALTHPKLSQHIIMGEAIMPAAGYLEMIFESGANLAWNIRFWSMLPLTNERLLPVNLVVDGPSWSVNSELQLNPSKTRVHATGFMTTDGALESAVLKLSVSDMQRNFQQIDVSNFYQTLTHFAQYGPVYQRLVACWKSDAEALVEIRAHDDDLTDLDSYVLHPALLDACFHAIVHPMFTADADRSVYYLPESIETVALYDPSFVQTTRPRIVYSHIVFRSWDPDGMNFDISIAVDSGAIICQLLNFRIAQHRKTADVPASEYQSVTAGRHEMVYQPLLVLAPHSPLEEETAQSISTCVEANDIPFSVSLNPVNIVRKNCQDALESILAFLSGLGGKKVIRLLSVGTGISCRRELLVFLDMPLAVGLGSNYMLEIHILAEDGTIPSQYLHGHKIGKTFSALPSAELALFYDVILDQIYPDATTHNLEFLVPFLLPGGFILVASGNDIVNVPHSLWRNHVNNNPSLSLKSGVSQGTTDNQVIGNQHPLHFELAVVHSDEAVVSFRMENALALRRRFQLLSDHETLWIHAPQDIHGYAALGLVRTLRKEFSSKDIRLALFDTQWSEDGRYQMTSLLSSYPYIEQEVVIDSAGTIYVPRIIPASIKHDVAKLHPFSAHRLSMPTGQHDTISHVLPPSDHVSVKILASSFEYGNLRAIVGCITDDIGSMKWQRGTDVIAITSLSALPETDHIFLPEAILIQAHNAPGTSPDVVVQAAMTVFIAALAIGSEVLTEPETVKGLRVLITKNTPEDDPFIQILSGLLRLLNVTVVQTSKDITTSIINDIRSCHFGFTGWTCRSDIEVIKSLLPDSASLISLHSASPSMSALLSCNPWIVSHILRDTRNLLWNFLQDRQTSDICHLPPSGTQRKAQRIEDNLFKASLEYFLIGGLGSLGIRMALWMYEHGARHIVLTSRRGNASSLTGSNDEMACRVLEYLQRQQDLQLRLEACDASSHTAMYRLFRSSEIPVGGCILMSVVLSDKLYISHDHSSYYIPFAPKVDALIALENAVHIPSLDFLVSISSAATFGNAGQTNYSSANTALDGLLSKYRHAFSLISPAITDGITISHGINLMPDQRYREWLPWSMTCSELFRCLGDGIQSISQERFSAYIPRLNWHHLKKHLGSSPLYDHLVYEGSFSSQEPPATSKDLLYAIVTKTLGIDQSDFSSDMPLTSYGLDSLSAGRLSHSLKPFIQISQLQLLADITLNQIERRIQEGLDVSFESPPDGTPVERDFDWTSLNQPGQTVVKLVKGEGNPLILIHGGSGNISAFISLQELFTTPLWAIQNTPECPTTSLRDMAVFYYLQIKAVQPIGPYRIGGFCSGSILAIEIGYLLQNSGNRVIQLVLLDHWPALYGSPLFPLDSDTIQTRRASQNLMAVNIEYLLNLYASETAVLRQKIGIEIKRAYEGGATTEYTRPYIEFFPQFVTLIANFLIELGDIKTPEDLDVTKMYHLVKEWTLGLGVPLTLAVAENGTCKAFPQYHDYWTDFTWTGEGPINVQSVGHFSLLESLDLVRTLESGWKQ